MESNFEKLTEVVESFAENHKNVYEFILVAIWQIFIQFDRRLIDFFECWMVHWRFSDRRLKAQQDIRIFDKENIYSHCMVRDELTRFHTKMFFFSCRKVVDIDFLLEQHEKYKISVLSSHLEDSSPPFQRNQPS